MAGHFQFDAYGVLTDSATGVEFSARLPCKIEFVSDGTNAIVGITPSLSFPAIPFAAPRKVTAVIRLVADDRPILDFAPLLLDTGEGMFLGPLDDA